MSKLLLGERYRDKIFGLEGILMSRMEHMHLGLIGGLEVMDRKEKNEFKSYKLPMSRLERIPRQAKAPKTTVAGRKHKIKFGKEYVDIVNGVKGIAVSRTEHLTGCERVTLEYIKSDGEIMQLEIDESILEQVEAPKPVKKAAPKKSKPGAAASVSSHTLL